MYVSFQVLRIQSPDHGTKRVNAKPTDRVLDFLEKVCALSTYHVCVSFEYLVAFTHRLG